MDLNKTMLTIFSIPKPFCGHTKIIQTNAIHSWTTLLSECEIILFGNEEGMDDIATKFGVTHIPRIKRNEFGTPLISDAFSKAKEIAKYKKLAYVNSDIILMNDFTKAIEKIKEPSFLMIGQRWDAEIKEKINFNEPGWAGELCSYIKAKGKLHGPSGIDYFVFPRELEFELPPFTVGRIGWDNWLIYYIRSLRIPIIDATRAVTAIHQNHDYSHSPWGKKSRVEGPETQRNLKLIGDLSNMLTLRDADWILTPNGLERPGFLRRILSGLSLFYPWRKVLSIKRRLQKFL